MTQTIRLSCTCGEVHLDVEGAPIISAECCCNSCRAAAARMERLAGAGRVLEENGTTRFVMYRKDRIRFVKGTDHLKAFRLTPRSTTRRVVAGCCNTPVFLEFKGGHWLSLYRHIWPAGTLPPVELRTMTSDLPAGSVLPGDVPNARRQTVRFFARLFGAWVAMGFRSPKIAFVKGEIDA